MRKVKVFFLVLFFFFLWAWASLLALDVNTATEEELAELPGIGPVLARRIVEYRRTHGPFRGPEDLLAIKGIGPKRLSRLKAYLDFGKPGFRGGASEEVPETQLSSGPFIYRWVDEKGVVHFTEFPEEIPARYRARAERIPFSAGHTGKEESLPESPRPSPKASSGKASRKPATDILGRDLAWYRKEKVRLKNEIARLRAQIEENRQVMRLLHGGSPQARRGTRTKYGLKLGKGPLLRRWAEYKRLRRINQELEKKLAELEYRLEKGLYREALRTHAPEEVLKFLKEDP